MGITVLFLDEKVNSVIQGFIPSRRANHYMPSLKAGSIVKVDRFEVARCSSMYKIIDHPFLIRFISPTVIDEVITGAPEIHLQS
uniref:Replication protein A 70 kDa DNA-binding subunit B/D first OB fold domain-containing protein n=1 Tax=Brassica oleracea var. oleracea TaxID=109376 RepID=A0A0D3D0E8_BRAOL